MVTVLRVSRCMAPWGVSGDGVPRPSPKPGVSPEESLSGLVSLHLGRYPEVLTAERQRGTSLPPFLFTASCHTHSMGPSAGQR